MTLKTLLKRAFAFLAMALLLGPIRTLLDRSGVLAPMTSEALLIVMIGVSLFVYWLCVLYRRNAP